MTIDKHDGPPPSMNGIGNVGVADYEVGHGRPPQSTRFKQGVSGNPRGRPKRRLQLNKLFHLALDEQLPVSATGKRETALFAFIQSLVDRTLKRDPNALRSLMRIFTRVNAFRPIAPPNAIQGAVVEPPEYRQDRRTGAHIGKLYYGTANDGTKVPFYGIDSENYSAHYHGGTDGKSA